MYTSWTRYRSLTIRSDPQLEYHPGQEMSKHQAGADIDGSLETPQIPFLLTVNSTLGPEEEKIMYTIGLTQMHDADPTV